MSGTRILIVGGDSFIGQHLNNQFRTINSVQVTTTSRRKNVVESNPEALFVDLEQDVDWLSIQNKFQFDCVYWVSQIKDVKWCEDNADSAFKINMRSIENALRCFQNSEKNPQFIFLSSDYVFDGKTGNYKVTDQVNPTQLYGQLKVKVEQLLAESKLVTRSVRTSAVFGKNGVFFDWVVSTLKKSEQMESFGNSYFTPTSVKYLCQVLVDLGFDTNLKEQHSLLHVCGDQRYSRYEFVKKICDSWSECKAQVLVINNPAYEKFDLSLVGNYFGLNREHSWNEIMSEVNSV